MRGRPYFMWCRSTTPYFFTITSSLPLASPSGGGKETHHKPSPWGKVPAEQADEGPRKINAAYIFCAVPHPALSGHPPPRGGLCTSSLFTLHSSLFQKGEAKERGNGFPRADALGMTYIFCLVYLHGHCEEGPCPDAAIRIPRPHSLFSILYSLFFRLLMVLLKNKE